MVCAMRSIRAEGSVQVMARAPIVLAIEDLDVAFETTDGVLDAVAGFTLSVRAGECVGIVGESGAGKSQALLAILGLLPPNAQVRGSARFENVELIGASPRELNRVRGSRATMIFQDPMTSLTPHMRIGRQIGESLMRHRRCSSAEARRRTIALLERVHLSDPQRRLEQYPHELSGGMRQRAMIALALACDPALLIADEPTTALDVTIQAQILALLAELKRERDLALVLVTHDFGVVAGIADRVAVMYGGRIVETGSVVAILKSPMHPYTRALLRSMPRIDTPADVALPSIRGQPPNARSLPTGCAFHPRCDLATALCRSQRPTLEAHGEASAACHFPLV
jgi:oligopeptide transport system ATP-binding protein